MTVEEGNDLIAHYMGFVKVPDGYPGNYVWMLGDTIYRSWELDIVYDKSYNNLMPVWFKIQKWYASEFGLLTSTFEMSSLGIIIKATSSKAFQYAESFYYAEGNIAAIWRAVVSFIQWYNNYEKN